MFSIRDHVPLRDRLRWTVRALLRLAPRRRHRLVPATAESVLLLFAGTYGDFVQMLPLLAEAARYWPRASLWLHAPALYLDAFSFALPPRVQRASRWRLLRFALNPADLLLVNAVGVYRVRYDVLALRLGRVAAGFRYAHEPFRAGWGWSVPLTPEVANFGEMNQQLPQAVAARRQPTDNLLPWRARIDLHAPFPFTVPVLFTVGSAGFKRDVGLAAYLGIVDDVLEALRTWTGGAVTVVVGPDDGDVAAHLERQHAGIARRRESVAELAETLRQWPGGVIGFNSFMAHFALYLGKRMAVLHHTAVPYGYDCAPFHRQLVLRREDGYAVGPVRDFLAEVAMTRQDLPPETGAGKKLP